jgi:hypothetical protein
MNPPFGTAGKTAMEHVEKAAKHLKEATGSSRSFRQVRRWTSG